MNISLREPTRTQADRICDHPCPKSTQITTHQLLAQAPSPKNIGEHPRAAREWPDPRETYERLLIASAT